MGIIKKVLYLFFGIYLGLAAIGGILVFFQETELFFRILFLALTVLLLISSYILIKRAIKPICRSKNNLMQKDEPIRYKYRVPETKIWERKYKEQKVKIKEYNCPFHIKCGISPEPEGYKRLNEEEELFLREFEKKLLEAKISPYNIELTRLSSGGFNVDHINGYVGKLFLRHFVVEDKYAVWRNGGKRALRVFSSEKEAEDYKAEKKADRIEFRPGYSSQFHMQYLKGLYTAKEIYSDNVKELIDAIPNWIKYIKRYLK